MLVQKSSMLCFMLYVFFSCNAYFVKLSILRPPQEGKQLVFLVGDLHGYSDLESRHLRLTLSGLRSVESDTNHDTLAFYSLVEALPTFMDKEEGFGGQPGVLDCLAEMVAKLKLKRTIVNNQVDLRKLGKAASVIMLSANPLTLTKFFEDSTFAEKAKQYFECNLEAITFKEVLQEFERQRVELLRLRDHWHEEHIRRNFDEALEEASKKCQELQVWVASHSEIAPYQPILQYANSLAQKYLVIARPEPGSHFNSIFDCEEWAARGLLYDLINKAFTPMIDLNAYHQILLLRSSQVEKIILFVGEAHRIAVSKFLQNSGYDLLHDFFSDDEKREPLPKAEFERFKKGYDETLATRTVAQAA